MVSLNERNNSGNSTSLYTIEYSIISTWALLYTRFDAVKKAMDGCRPPTCTAPVNLVTIVTFSLQKRDVNNCRSNTHT